MRYEATATCLSWIPPTAVEGVFSLPFGLGVAHFDQPPPDQLQEIEALLSADAIRFANQLHAWIEVQDGQIIAHGMSGGGHLGSTTVRLRSHGLTFAGVALPDLIPPPEVQVDRVHFTQTAGGHAGTPVSRPASRSPFWQLIAPIATGVTRLTHAPLRPRAKTAAPLIGQGEVAYAKGAPVTRAESALGAPQWGQPRAWRDCGMGKGLVSERDLNSHVCDLRRCSPGP